LQAFDGARFAAPSFEGRGNIGEICLIMGEPQQTIAVAGATPFAFVLAGLLAADHGCKVFMVAGAPSQHDVPPPPSFSIAPVTRPETLQLASANAPEIMRRIAKISPASIDRTDVLVSAVTPWHAAALSHFRHIATGLGHMVERLADTPDGGGMALRIRDVTRLSPAPFLANMRDWTYRIGVEWVEDANALTLRRNGTAQLGEMAIDRLVLADDAAMLSRLGPTSRNEIGKSREHVAYIAERRHGVDDPHLMVPAGTLLSPLRDGTLAIFADNANGLADARVAACLPDGAVIRRAAQRQYRQFRTHDGAPVTGTPKGSRLYVTAGLGMLDIALAPVIARHICGEAHGFEAEWCAMRSPAREMPAGV
jgi:hypothetical protein